MLMGIHKKLIINEKAAMYGSFFVSLYYIEDIQKISGDTMYLSFIIMIKPAAILWTMHIRDMQNITVIFKFIFYRTSKSYFFHGNRFSRH